MKMHLVLGVVVLAALARVEGFSQGAPESACKDMIPRHGVPPQSSTPPYTITTSTKAIKPDQTLKVKISGKSARDTIKGFLVQARLGEKPVGKFILDPNDTYSKLICCGDPNTAVTHTKHEGSEDRNSIEFAWTPLTSLNADIKFRATIAYNGTVFWVGLESEPVKVSN